MVDVPDYRLLKKPPIRSKLIQNMSWKLLKYVEVHKYGCGKVRHKVYP